MSSARNRLSAAAAALLVMCAPPPPAGAEQQQTPPAAPAAQPEGQQRQTGTARVGTLRCDAAGDRSFIFGSTR